MSISVPVGKRDSVTRVIIEPGAKKVKRFAEIITKGKPLYYLRQYRGFMGLDVPAGIAAVKILHINLFNILQFHPAIREPTRADMSAAIDLRPLTFLLHDRDRVALAGNGAGVEQEDVRLGHEKTPGKGVGVPELIIRVSVAVVKGAVSVGVALTLAPTMT